MVRYYGRARQITGTVFTNQPGLKQAGCPGTVGKRGTIVRFLGRRVNCNLKTCGLPTSGLRCKYGVRAALGNMKWKDVESSNNPAIPDYCHQVVNKWNGVHCRWPQPKNRQLAGGVGNIWTPRRNHCEKTCSLGFEEKYMGKHPDGPIGSDELPDWVALLVNAQNRALEDMGWTWDEATNTLEIVDVSGAGGWVWGGEHGVGRLDIPADNSLIIAYSLYVPSAHGAHVAAPQRLPGTLSNTGTIDVQGTIIVENGSTLSNDSTFTPIDPTPHGPSGLGAAGVINIQKGGTIVVGDGIGIGDGGTISNMFSNHEFFGQINIMPGGTLANFSGPNPWPPEKTTEWLSAQEGIQNVGGAINNNGTIINQGLFFNAHGSVANGFWPLAARRRSPATFINRGRFANYGPAEGEGGDPLAADRNLLTNTGTITNVGNGGGAGNGVITIDGSIVQNAGLIDNSGNITNRFILHNMNWDLRMGEAAVIDNHGIIYCQTCYLWVGAIVNDDSATIVNYEGPAYPDPTGAGVIAIQGPLLDGAYWLEQWKDSSSYSSQFTNYGSVFNQGQILMAQSPTSPPPFAPQDPSMNQFRNYVSTNVLNGGSISCSPMFARLLHASDLPRMPMDSPCWPPNGGGGPGVLPGKWRGPAPTTPAGGTFCCPPEAC